MRGIVSGLFLLVAAGSAQAAPITYRFTATNSGSFINSVLPATSYVGQAAPLSTISGFFTYDTAATLLPGGDGVTLDFYSGTMALALDQFATASPALPPSVFTVGNDPIGGDEFSALPESPSNAGLAFGFYDSFRLFFYDAEATAFQSTSVPTTLILSQFLGQFDVASISLITWDHRGNRGSVDRSLVRFNITSLSQVAEVPVPGAFILFASALGLGAVRRAKFLAGPARRFIR